MKIARHLDAENNASGNCARHLVTAILDASHVTVALRGYWNADKQMLGTCATVLPQNNGERA